MRGLRGVVIASLLVWLAAGLQAGTAGRLSIFGAQPDFLLLVLSCLGVFCGRVGGAVLGFVCGVAYGAVAGANLAQYAISRTLVGFGLGWYGESGFARGAAVASVAAMLAVLGAQAALMLSAPPPEIGPFMGDTIRAAMVNGALAFPLYALLERLLDPDKR